MFRVLCFMAAMLAAWSTPLLADSGKERLEEFRNNMRGLRGDFVQNVLDEKLNPLEQSHGTLALKRPNQFRFEYLEPLPQLIVADGQEVWIYDIELNQVTVRAIGDTIGNTPALLLSSDEPLERSFVITELGEQGGLQWVGLEPLATDATYTMIRIGLDASTMQMMEMTDTFGQITQLRFSNLQRNAVLDPVLFQFAPPAGVDVLRDGASAATGGTGSTVTGN